MYGGALLVGLSSRVSRTGQTYFRNNAVVGSGGLGIGGAIYILDCSLSWNGTTVFANNSAATGGAVYPDIGTTITWGGTATFRDNAAGANGGAVALVDGVTVDIQAVGTELLLVGNIAGIAGGAVYQSSIKQGTSWKGATFMSNSALNGGAVYSVDSGAGTVDARSFPNVYTNCLFQGNTAAVSGGAVDSAAGRDDFVNVSFRSYTVGKLGGALRMAGITSITRCAFVGNGAEEAGPAVSNVGTILLVDNSFANNNLLCAPGAFLNYTVEVSCVKTVRLWWCAVMTKASPVRRELGNSYLPSLTITVGSLTSLAATIMAQDWNCDVMCCLKRA